MKIILISIGKAHDASLREAIDDFTIRIGHFMPVEWKIIEDDTKLMKAIGEKDYVIALDEKGKTVTSLEFSTLIQKRLNESQKTLVFIIGGAYGLTTDIRARAQATISFSALTFPHQLMRLILVEQIYRACTILHNQKYHHE